MRVAIASDHGGFEMKEDLKAYLAELGLIFIDFGPHNTEAVDYPDYAVAVAEGVSRGLFERGLMVDGAGIGSCMAANKVPGVRAAMCYDLSTARNAREHNNANVLTLGGTLIGKGLARQIVKEFLQTEFGGGRHARRVDKIDALRCEVEGGRTVITGKVIGVVVATRKDPGLSGRKLLVIQGVKANGEHVGKPFVAVDLIGAGADETVMLARARDASMAAAEAPVDMAVVGIVDQMTEPGLYPIDLKAMGFKVGEPS